MKQTREIKHGDGHIDIETLFGDVWAVTKCNLEVAMYNGYTEAQSHTAARAWNTAMQSVGYMRYFRPLNTEAEADAIYAFIQAAEAGEKVKFNLSAEQADLAERASGCWTSYTPSAKELSKRVQPEMKEAQEVADNFNFDEIKPIKF